MRSYHFRLYLYFVAYNSQSYKEVVLKGALFGFVLYGCYDITNLIFLTDYSIRFVIIDIIWGTFVCSIASTVAYSVKIRLEK